MKPPLNPPSAEHVIAFTALAGLGAIAWGLLFWPIPEANAQAMTFILGAIAGALGVPTINEANGGKPPETPNPQPSQETPP